MEFKFGDIILIKFPFTDLTNTKLRPSVVLSNLSSDLVLSFITSQIKNQEENDLILEPSEENGLKVSSILKLCKIATLDKSLAIGKIGSLSNEDIEKVKINLIRMISKS